MRSLSIIFAALFLFSPLSAQTQKWERINPITQWSAKDTTWVAKWNVLEISLKGPKSGNPYKDVHLRASFSQGGKTINVRGFYDGGGDYKIRFMPQSDGKWRFSTTSQTKKLDGISGNFICIAADSASHGPVRVDDTFHFTYADGSPYRPIGTTAYAWIHQPKEKQLETLQTLTEAPFNKIRMTIFPKSYVYNRNEPELYPFPRKRKGKNDLGEFNPKFFRHLEQRIINLMNLGIEADVILFHPYDRWGYAEMSKDQDDFYLQYVIARLAAFRNVWWSLANEYDFMLTKTDNDWTRFFKTIYEQDPYSHLRSIHNGRKIYDHSLPWVTHASIQSHDFTQMKTWLATFQKPVLIDECQYEGNIIQGWGRISAEELVNRFWKGVTSGGYVTHGETIKDPKNEWIWWAKGGLLHGDSPQRINFLQSIMDEFPSGLNYINEQAAGIDGEFYLHYFGEERPTQHEFNLPPHRNYRAEIIDAWNMTITPIDSIFSNTFTLDLPGEPFFGVRIHNAGLVFPEEPVSIISNGAMFLNRMIVQLAHRTHKNIYYTIDGTTPTQSSHQYSQPIVVDQDSTVIKAVSFTPDGRASELVRRLFLKSNPFPGIKPGNIKSGLRCSFYFGLWEKMPDFSDMHAASQKTIKRFDLSAKEQNDAFGLVIEGLVKAPVNDVYTFTTTSDDGSKLYIDGRLVVDNDFQHAPERKSGQIGLKAGYHNIRLEYFEAGGGEELKVYWQCSAFEEDEISSKALFVKR
jgi:hypothetical protein